MGSVPVDRATTASGSADLRDASPSMNAGLLVHGAACIPAVAVAYDPQIRMNCSQRIETADIGFVRQNKGARGQSAKPRSGVNGCACSTIFSRLAAKVIPPAAT